MRGSGQALAGGHVMAMVDMLLNPGPQILQLEEKQRRNFIAMLA